MSFDKFYFETKDGFFKYLYYLCSDYETASDIFQESYYKMYQKYQDNPNRGLLYKIGKNAFLDTKRKKKEVYVDQDFLSSFKDDYNNVSEEKEDDVLEKLLAKLDDETRHIFTLKIISDMKYREIAEITGHSEANIKVIIHRARKTLRKHFKEV
ncbi:MAG: sigma-70 family RNA polymerase sigma factor [Flexistipes sinusarabici]|uniref:Sigma-70 family RNA polymerase sigma factor n=1 Tax=Flexistipes sinusarabici TaxID=2352 RepID=A0A5D0MPB1_FLESI|nr:sigma-70 family RNA polymerase sigma factor [Flexistipes sinusarabici]TYB32489.1 MAG: sigma-70 family RNA polymerase sigma factor [Flexistipes sinusarabici]